MEEIDVKIISNDTLKTRDPNIEKMVKEMTEDHTIKYLKENINKNLIIFCNPLSGNQEGKIFLKIANRYQTMENYKLIDYPYLEGEYQYENIKAVFFELINKEDKEKGIKLLKSCTEKCKENEKNLLIDTKIKTIIAGGDGTVLSMIEEFKKNEIDINYCIFGHIPLGTGNDLSNSIGFKSSVDISDDVNKLYKILLKYFYAKNGKIDVWKMCLILDNFEGEILLNSKNGKKKLLDNNGQIIKNYQRTFINYLSLGYDARIGYNFDKKRTHSRIQNKCVYFCEGFKKMFCRKTITLQHFLDTFTVYDSPDNSINESTFFDEQNSNEIINTNIHKNLNSNINYNITEKIKFQFKSKYSSSIQNSSKNLVIKGDPCSIIFQNIAMYMSGTKDIWGKAKNKTSLKVLDDVIEDKKKYENKIKTMDYENQKLDDKKLEVFTFESGFQTGLEKVSGGHANKLYHGRGPMEIKFFETPVYSKSDKKDRIYLNVDGEFFQIVKPLKLRIELNRNLCNGQLPFLINI